MHKELLSSEVKKGLIEHKTPKEGLFDISPPIPISLLETFKLWNTRPSFHMLLSVSVQK